MTFYIFFMLGLMFGTVVRNRREFVELGEVKRYLAFIKSYPQHPAVKWHDEKAVYALLERKRAAVREVKKSLALYLIWPLTLLYIAGTLAYEWLTDKNHSMAPKVTIDHDLIREEEGRR